MSYFPYWSRLKTVLINIVVLFSRFFYSKWFIFQDAQGKQSWGRGRGGGVPPPITFTPDFHKNEDVTKTHWYHKLSKLAFNVQTATLLQTDILQIYSVSLFWWICYHIVHSQQYYKKRSSNETVLKKRWNVWSIYRKISFLEASFLVKLYV